MASATRPVGYYFISPNYLPNSSIVLILWCELLSNGLSGPTQLIFTKGALGTLLTDGDGQLRVLEDEEEKMKFSPCRLLTRRLSTRAIRLANFPLNKSEGLRTRNLQHTQTSPVHQRNRSVESSVCVCVFTKLCGAPLNKQNRLLNRR